MKRYIEISDETRKMLVKTFKVSRVAIWKALHFESQSNLSQHIRHMAKLHGGVVMVVMPEAALGHPSPESPAHDMAGHGGGHGAEAGSKDCELCN